MAEPLDLFISALYVLYYIPLAFAAHFYHVKEYETSMVIVIVITAAHFVIGGIAGGIEGMSKAMERFKNKKTGPILIMSNIILTVSLAFAICGAVTDSNGKYTYRKLQLPAIILAYIGNIGCLYVNLLS